MNPPAVPDVPLWGQAVRPPQAAWDGMRYQGPRGPVLAASRRDAVASQAGVVAVVQAGHFLGVVAVSALYARQAAADLAPAWQADPVHRPAGPALPDAGASAYAWGVQPAAADDAARVVVWCLHGHVSVWMPGCTPALRAGLRLELSALLSIAPQNLALIESPDAVSGHGLGLLDTVADAALLSQAVGRPVAMAVQARPADKRVLVLRTLPATASLSPSSPSPSPVPAGLPTLHSDAPWSVRPSMARMLSQPVALALAGASAVADGPILGGGLDTALTGADVDALNAAQVFAQESQWSEQAVARGEDPLAWRLRHLPAGPGADLARRVARPFIDAAPMAPGADGSLRGRGFATARTEQPGDGGRPEIRWSAWLAEVAVHPSTGQVDVLRVVAGQDSESLRPVRPADVMGEIAGQDPLLLAHARHLFSRAAAAFDDWKSPAPAASAMSDVACATTRTDLAHGQGQGQLHADGVLTLPAAAAIANAIHDATGVRLRQVPFDAEQLRLQLAGGHVERPARRLHRGAAWLAIGAAGIAGLLATAWPATPALPPTDGPDLSLYSAQAVERGRLVAAAGDCVVCHTLPGGARNAGGLGLETPFGTVYSTNITPDPQTGIGRWSYAAFERAMRHGIHRDGRRLYPAFPYTAFAKLSDGDVQSLYAYLMSQPATVQKPRETRLAFPYGFRQAMAGWNLLFHDATPFEADPARTAEWNRGAYLVEGAGHCSACHSPRNALGAEKSGPRNHLGGGEAEGWTAPALNDLAGGKTPWTRDTLQQYLRTGFSPRHGVAAGPMAPVVQGLAELPESDIGAMATYLLSLPGSVQPKPVAAASPVAGAATTPTAPRHPNGERIYRNACAVCHEAGSGPTLFGIRPDLAANTNLRSATPDNLIRTILHGIQNPASGELGYMPGFEDSLDDSQIGDLAAYLRERFAPGEKPWADALGTVRGIRAKARP